MSRVRFLPSGREIEVRPGTWLTAAAVRAGVPIVHDCDGQGVCSTCRVRVTEGAPVPPRPDERERFQLGGLVDEGWRLCCLLKVSGDLTVEVPEGGFAYPPGLQRE